MKFIHQICNRSLYKLCFLSTVFLNTLSLGFFQISITPLCLMLIAWGCIILIVDLLEKQLVYRGNHTLYLLGFSVCLGIATFSNEAYTTRHSYLLLVMQILIFFLIFTQRKDTSLSTIKKEMRHIQKLTCFLTFIGGMLSILMFFLNISAERNGAYIGLVGDRLFGVYFNCNPAAFLACMSIVFSFLAIRNKYSFRIFYVINIAIQTLYIILTNTRSAIIILLVLLIVLLYYTLFKRREYTVVQKTLIVLAVSFVFLITIRFVRQFLYLIPQMQGAIFAEGGRFQLDKVKELLDLMRSPWENKGKIYEILNSVSSRRVELWYDAYQIWRTSPFTGIGIGNFKSMGQVMFTSGLFDGPTIVHTHNFMMESLVTSGVFGFVCFFLFCFRSFTAFLETLRKYNHTKSYFMILMIGFIVFIEILGGALDYGVFYIYSMSSVLLWVYLGYLYWLNDHPRMKLVNDSMVYDFVNYHLKEVKYFRKPEEENPQAAIEIISGRYFPAKDMYVVRLSIELMFQTEHRSQFQYDGLFEIRKNGLHEDKVKEYEQEMALEIYEIVKENIETFISDASDTIHLPAADMMLIVSDSQSK